jgi:hypothetical protein
MAKNVLIPANVYNAGFVKKENTANNKRNKHLINNSVIINISALYVYILEKQELQYRHLKSNIDICLLCDDPICCCFLFFTSQTAQASAQPNRGDMQPQNKGLLADNIF